MELRCTFHVISSDLRCYPILYIAATLWRVQLTCNCRAVSEDRPEADLLATVTVLSLIGHVVAEKGADSAPRCLRLVREIVATPGDAFAVRLAVISDSSSSAFIKETLATALSASETELGFNRIEALAALPAIEAALSAAADYTRIVR